MTGNEREAWNTANMLWTELNYIGARIYTGAGTASWSDTERQYIKRTLECTLDNLNAARTRANPNHMSRKKEVKS